MDLEDDLLIQEWEDDSSFVDFDILSALETSKNGVKPQLSEKGERFLQQMDEDLDFALALSLQTEYEEELKENASTNLKKSTTDVACGSKPISIIDEQWELIDPHPDIHALFIEYDKKFFYGKLKGVEVRWSSRMTLCAGVCCYEGRGGLCSIRLSVPLLKLRPRKDLVETLLHEMIHAYLFVTHNNKVMDREGHGPEFLSHMSRINRETGTKISVYHSFHNEVDLYRQHWWKCDGPCRKRRPFFGLVKRAMNRAPGPKDNWWTDHQTSCGGKFTKIKEPDNYNKKKTTKRKLSSASDSKESSDIRSFLKDDSSSFGKRDNSKSTFKSLKDESLSSDKFNNSKSTVKSYKGSDLSAGNSDNSQSSFKSSNIFDFKSLKSKEDNLVSANQNGISEKKIFTPFHGTGFKLGGTSEKSVLSSKLTSSHNKSNKPSSSSGIVQELPHTSNAKLPRISNSSDAKSVQKGQLNPTTNEKATKMIQSPIGKFLSPKIESGSSKPVPKKVEFIDLSDSPRETVAPKVQCPVCSVLVKENDINSHLDNCLF